LKASAPGPGLVKPRELILASASPRRRELLTSLGITYAALAANVDETPHPGEPPDGYVRRLAEEKASAIAVSQPGKLVLGADTAVVLGGEILGKPEQAAIARQMLARLSGEIHSVFTAVALSGVWRESLVVETRVEFRILCSDEIDWYVRTGEPLDKAGGYAIQGRGGFLVRSIQGSFSNVVGLPLAETLEMLARSGMVLPWTR
jgi:septum formation protein